MPLARINNRILYFAHIPKTGGTTVEEYLFAKGSVALFLDHEWDWSRTTPQHMQRSVYSCLVPSDFYDFGFTLVRDPLKRLISEFRMRSKPQRRTFNPMNRIRMAKSRFTGQKCYAFEIGKRIVFLDFNDWVDRAFREYQKDPYFRDNHIRPQHEFVDPSHKVFLLEDGIEQVFRWIDQVTDTAPLEGEFDKGRSGNKQYKCTDETLAKVREFYKDDYALIEELRRQQPLAPSPSVRAAIPAARQGATS